MTASSDAPDPSDPLARYRAKRSPDTSPEPVGRVASTDGSLFVVHKHAARHLHYDLRMEMDGVLRSWAVPKGPSFDMADKRLAVHVEDHPLEYGDFEGIIPAGNYGAGGMIVWDRGEWVPLEDWRTGLEKGKLLFELHGHKLHGKWTLVRIKKSEKDWLLIKERDAWARSPGDDFPQTSVLSGLTVEEVKEGRGPGTRLREAIAKTKAPKKRVDPASVTAMLAEPADDAFTRDGWLFELKLDGYRLLASRTGDDVVLRTRKGNDYTAVFPEIARAVRALPLGDCILDGEVVVLDPSGRPSFARLQRRGRLTSPMDVRHASVELAATFFVFDLLAVDDWDLRPLELRERKALMLDALPRMGVVRALEHIEREGERVLEHVSALGLEGIIAKKADSPYRGGRSDCWLKIKQQRTGDFVIVGFTRPRGSRGQFGALQLADRVNGALVYAGRAGTGFTDATLRELHDLLTPLVRETPPCLGPAVSPNDAPRSERDIPDTKTTTWVEPRIVCEVRFGEFTPDGLLRHPAFLHLRHDKQPDECERQIWPAESSAEISDGPRDSASSVARPGGDDAGDASLDANNEKPARKSRARKRVEPDAISDARDARDDLALSDAPAASGKRGRTSRTRAGAATTSEPAHDEPPPPSVVATPARNVSFSNLRKSYWPADGYIKGDLIDYYRSAAPWLLPYLRDRPMVLTRFPDGIDGKSFYQKDAPEFAPSWLRTEPIWSEDTQREINYIVCDDVETLLWVANLGSIPLHMWASRCGSLEQPDWCVMDLDPKEAPFSDVVRTAIVLRRLCEQIGLPSYVKTTGKSGLHILLPLGRQCTYAQSRTLGELLARVVLRELDDIATITRHVTRRGDKVYLDYLQNRHGQTIVAPFSVRPLPGATVSMPLEWDEVNQSLDPRTFTIKNAIERMERLGRDPVSPVLEQRPDLHGVLQRLAELLTSKAGESSE